MATRRRKTPPAGFTPQEDMEANPLDSLEPSEETLEAIQELEEGSGTSDETVEELFDDLHEFLEVVADDTLKAIDEAEEKSDTADFFQAAPVVHLAPAPASGNRLLNLKKPAGGVSRPAAKPYKRG